MKLKGKDGKWDDRARVIFLRVFHTNIPPSPESDDQTSVHLHVMLTA